LWSSNKYLGNAGAKEIMPVRRYQKINQYLHANGSWRENPQDKLFKVRPLLDSVSDRCLTGMQILVNFLIPSDWHDFLCTCISKILVTTPQKCVVVVWNLYNSHKDKDTYKIMRKDSKLIILLFFFSVMHDECNIFINI
jgi:hypothetical protein